MPKKPTTPRRPSNQRRSAPVTPTDGENTAGLYESNLVQDRIRQWQAQGAADAHAPDDVSIRSLPVSDVASEHRAGRKTKDKSRGDEDKVVSRPDGQSNKIKTRTRSSRWADPESREWVREARSSSTPRKRVISDEHWKAKPSPKESRTQPVADRENSYSRDIRDTSSPSFPLSKEEREERRRRRREARKLRATPDGDRHSDGIRVYATPPRSPKPYDDEDGALGRRKEKEHDAHGAFSGRGSPMVQDDDDCSVRPDEDDGRYRRRSKYAETLGRDPMLVPAPGSSMGDVRSRKGRLLSKTKEMFSKSEAVPMTSNRLPSIEAWLEEQPDPFVENEILLEDVEIPRPLKTKSRRRKVSVEPTIAEDSNRIREHVEGAEINKLGSESDPGARHRRTSKDKRKSPGGGAKSSPATPLNLISPASTEQEWVGEDSPTHLKRRGAKSSKIRTGSAAAVNHQAAVPQETQRVARPSAVPSPAEVEDTGPLPPPYRQCPPTGRHVLSTIASVETFQAKNEEAEVPLPGTDSCRLKRKLTTHEDLLSVLSQNNGRGLKSAKSLRRVRKLSQQEILDDIVAEEAKYSRELRTLVDGVIPVLLQSVLSKSGSTAAAGLFATSASASDDLNFAQPIIDMGVALERLKSSHNRIPTQDLDSLLSWAQTAHKAYKDYLGAWRLGFQNVVVNLEPLDESSIDQGMARDANGDVVDATGKKADVAYLLKRPLVRIKNLSKTFNRAKAVMNSARADKVAEDYVELTNLARRRSQEEQGRLEDETAANIDATKARDLRTMAAISGTVVEKSRRVKARDIFNMTLYHSSGQRVDCKIEMIFRDNQPGLAAGGDVLICEVEDTGKWLFFPPVETKAISARKGERPGDLVVMIRGRAGLKDWQELLSLRADDEEAAAEWMAMLGSNPLPPKLNRVPSFIDRKTESGSVNDGKATSISEGSQASSIPGVDVPIGEPSLLGQGERSKIPVDLRPQQYKTLPKLNLGGGLRQKTAQEQAYFSSARVREIQRKPLPSSSTISSGRSTISAESVKTPDYTPSTPRHIQDIRKQFESPGHEISGKTRGHSPGSPITPQSDKSPTVSNLRSPKTDLHKLSRTDDASREWMSSPDVRSSKEELDQQSKNQQLQDHARPSAPSQDLPSISKVRAANQYSGVPKNSPSDSNDSRPTALNDSIRDKWEAMSGREAGRHGPHQQARSVLPYTEDIPAPPPHSMRPRDVSPKIGPTGLAMQEEAPLPPPHKEVQPLRPSNGNAVVLKPSDGSPKFNKLQKRRSSSPLKHEYAPSTGSNSSSGSDSDDSSDASSETSEDLRSENGDAATPLVAVTGGKRRPSGLQYGKPGQQITTGTRTLAPSDSASQGPYRSVPPSTAIPGAQKSKTIALLCAWSDKGGWDPVHPDDCSIVISPGLIEAFEMSAAHSNGKDGSANSDGDSRTSSLTQQPLVAFELTPLVPLRRGTALDISIRSPPTANSKVKTTSNVMFRSRSPAECEQLYAMINWARCNNPTYMALERARPKVQPAVSFNTGPGTESRSRSSSWFGLGSQKRSSYRATSAQAPSIGQSEASIGSMASAFSALKRFGANSGFNLSRSSAVRQEGRSTGNSLYSSSSGTGGSSSNSPAPSQLGLIPGKDGPNVPPTSAAAANGAGMVNNMKIRLYIREGMHWVNLGAARLSVLPPPALGEAEEQARVPDMGTQYHARPSPNGGMPDRSSRGGPRLPSSSHTPHRIHGDGREKRIVVISNKNKSKNKDPEGEDPGAIYVDRVLGESCFERVMQNGIGVKIWEEDEVMKDRGGVSGGRSKYYMMQFPGAREAAWVFGLVGGRRYE